MQVRTRCVGCGSTVAEAHLQVSERLGLAPGERFAIVRCPHCGLMRLNPRPPDATLARFYPPSYAPFETDPPPLRRWLRHRYLAKLLRAVTRHTATKGQALDVGCATGLFLAALRQQGWQVAGIEPSAAAAHYAREHLGLTVHVGTLDDVPFADASFDLITLWHVLEHLPDPVAALQRLHSLLAPGGTLALTVPNAAGWDARLWGPWWAGWDAPRHLHHFTPPVLRRLLCEAGFEAVVAESFTDRHGMWVLSAAHWAGERPTSRRRRLAHRLLATLPAQALTYPYFWVAERLNRSAAITFFARRPTG